MTRLKLQQSSTIQITAAIYNKKNPNHLKVSNFLMAWRRPVGRRAGRGESPLWTDIIIIIITIITTRRLLCNANMNNHVETKSTTRIRGRPLA